MMCENMLFITGNMSHSSGDKFRQSDRQCRLAFIHANNANRPDIAPHGKWCILFKHLQHGSLGPGLF